MTQKVWDKRRDSALLAAVSNILPQHVLVPRPSNTDTVTPLSVSAHKVPFSVWKHAVDFQLTNVKPISSDIKQPGQLLLFFSQRCRCKGPKLHVWVQEKIINGPVHTDHSLYSTALYQCVDVSSWWGTQSRTTVTSQIDKYMDLNACTWTWWPYILIFSIMLGRGHEISLAICKFITILLLKSDFHLAWS